FIMKRLAMQWLIVLNVVFVQCVSERHHDSCPMNEHLGDRCANPDKRCGRQGILQTKPGSCTGCVCDEGFLRSGHGTCVSREQCDQCKGRTHEAYNHCDTACPLVCNVTFPETCNRMCVLRCSCLRGYSRSWPDDGPCVPIEDCPPLCKDKDREYTTCASSSDPTCFRFYPDEPSKPCDLGDGCRCKKGLMRSTDRKGDPCIAEEDCSSFTPPTDEDSSEEDDTDTPSSTEASYRRRRRPCRTPGLCSDG
ncbi:hypothetical protein HPB47_006664, partial [Ixodes persulcatus]